MATQAPHIAAEVPEQPDRPDVFISYARQDKQFVETRLVASLEARGKDVWIDLEDIPPAADWRERIWDGIEAAKAFVFVLSPISVGSEVCREELRRAVEANKRLIPVLHREVEAGAVPEALRRPNWIFMRDEDDFEAQFERLADALETDLDWVDRHARLAVRAREWGRAGRDRSLLLRGSDLKAAERWLAEQVSHDEAATPDQTRYILASRQVAVRRQRVTLGAVVVALVISLGLAVLAVLQRNQAVANEKTARSRELAGSALLTLSSDPELSVALSREANAQSPTSQALDALRQSVRRWPALAIFRHPGGPLQGAAYSPDGRMVLTANERSVRIWDATARRMIAELPDAGRIPVPTRFSPDSRAVLTSRGRTLTVFSPRTGRPLRALRFSDEVESARFSRSGRLLLVVSGPAVSVWAWPRARRVATLGAPGWDIRGADLGPDGGFVLGWGAATGKAAYRAFLWRLRDRRRVATAASEEPITAAAFESRGNVFVTASDDNTAELWRVQPSGSLRTVLHGNDVTAASFSSDGRAVLTSGLDGKARVWDASGLGQVAILEGATAGGAFHTASAFSPDGRRVATTDEAGGLQVWDVSRRRPILTVAAHRRLAVSAAFSPDGASVLTAGEDGTAREWRAGPEARELILRERREEVRTVELAPNGRTALTASDDGVARIWDVRTGRAILRLRHGGPLASAAVTDEGRLVVTAGRDGTSVAWRMADGRRLGDFSERWPLLTAWGSRTSGLVLLSGRAGRAAIWDARTRRRIAELRRRDDEAIDYAEFTPDGRYLLAGATSRPTRVWRVASGEQVSVLGGEDRVAYGASLSADGRFVANAEGGGLNVYETATGRLAPAPRGRAPGQASPVFSRDGTTLAITNAFEGRAQVFDWPSRKLLTELTGRYGAAAIDDRGAYLATVAGRTARVWEARTGERVATFPGPSEAKLVGLSGDGRTLLVGHRRGLVRLIPCEVCRSREDLLSLAETRAARSLTAAERRRYLHE